MAQDNEKIAEEVALNAKRRQHAQNLRIESEQKMAELYEASINGANRGQKMSNDEYRMNKKLLRKVAEIKKEGHFADINERSAGMKISEYAIK